MGKFDAMQAGAPVIPPPDSTSSSGDVAEFSPPSAPSPLMNTAPHNASASTSSIDNTGSNDQIDPPEVNPIPKYNNTNPTDTDVDNSTLPENHPVEDPDDEGGMNNITAPDTNPTPPIPTSMAPTAEPTAALLHFHLPDENEMKKTFFPDTDGSTTKAHPPSAANSSSSSVPGSSLVPAVESSLENLGSAAATLLNGGAVKDSNEITDPTTVSAAEEPEGGEEPADQYEVTDPTPVESADEPPVMTNASVPTVPSVPGGNAVEKNEITDPAPVESADEPPVMTNASVPTVPSVPGGNAVE